MPDMAMSHTSFFEGRDPYHEAQPDDRHVLASQWCVGATLKSAREAGGESLEEVAESVRIRPDYLRAIEDENYYGLPGWAHAVGYVRSYAMYLGLDSAPLVKRVRDQLALREHVFEQRADERSRSLGRLFSTGGAVVVVLALCVGLWTTGIAANVITGLRPPSERALSYLGAALGLGTSTGPTRVSTKTDAVPPPSRLPTASEDLPAPVAPQQNAAAIPFAPTARSLSINPVQPAPGQISSTTGESGLLVLKPLPRHSIDRGAASFGKVTLRALGQVWFRVEDHRGKVVAERELVRGEVQSLPDVRDLVIATRDGGAIAYYVDGAYAGILGSRGKSVKGLSLARLAVHRAGD